MMTCTAPVTLLLLLAVTALHLWSPATAGLPAAMTLERSLPVRGVGINELRARDLARDRAHNRRFLTAAAGVVDFNVEGSADPYTVGLYYTKVTLGNPQQEFYVQIDTGSDILWVTCNPCNGCPTSSGLNLHLEFFDPSKSSSASTISCSDSRCSSAMQTGEGSCTSSGSSGQCSYTFHYGDGSGSSGYYVSDTMYFNTVTRSGQSSNSSATIIFGCSNNQSGDLTKSDRALDGIFGFGQNGLSVISQLSSAGVSPKAFSHCLKGSDSGGGILVLGEIVEPGIVYTPLVPSEPHYYVNLQSIAVNGQQLNISSSVFSTSSTQGTIVDTGTTLAYLAEQAYDTFVNGISSAITSSLVQSTEIQGTQCYVTPSQPDDVFPTVTLNFENNASMNLKPNEYLLQQGSANNAIIWCIGWQKNQGGMTILGDLVLKDKIFVYDLANQRIGWVDYDCSQSVNVSASTGTNQYVNTRQADVSGTFSLQSFFSLLLMSFAILLVHIFA